MKKLLIIFSLFLSLAAQAQIYQKPLLYGREENKFMPWQNLGVPNDTIAPDANKKAYPHLATKNEVPYLWSPSLQKYVRMGSDSTGSIVVSWAEITGPISGNSQLQDSFLLKQNKLTPGTTSQFWDATGALRGLNTTIKSYTDTAYLRAKDTVNLDYRLDTMQTKLTTVTNYTNNLTFTGGLSKDSNIVYAQYYNPYWNANRIQGIFVDATRPGNGYFLAFDSTSGVHRFMKPDSVAYAYVDGQIYATLLHLHGDMDSLGALTLKYTDTAAMLSDYINFPDTLDLVATKTDLDNAIVKNTTNAITAPTKITNAAGDTYFEIDIGPNSYWQFTPTYSFFNTYGNTFGSAYLDLVNSETNSQVQLGSGNKVDLYLKRNQDGISGGIAILDVVTDGSVDGFRIDSSGILLKPYLGDFRIDSLDAGVGTKALRYNPTTGKVTYADTTTGGTVDLSDYYTSAQTDSAIAANIGSTPTLQEVLTTSNLMTGNIQSNSTGYIQFGDKANIYGGSYLEAGGNAGYLNLITKSGKDYYFSGYGIEIDGGWAGGSVSTALRWNNLTQNRQWQFPDSTGTIPIAIYANGTRYNANDKGTIDLGTISGGGSYADADVEDYLETYTGDVTATGTVFDITAGAIVNADINASAAIDVSKLADGSVSSTELQYINSLTSNAQTQISSKVTANSAITGATKTKITYDAQGLVTSGADLTPTDIPSLDAAKITSGTIATARLGSGTASASTVLAGDQTYKSFASIDLTGATIGNGLYYDGTTTIKTRASTTSVLKFKVGDSDAPAAGDSSVTHSAFAGKHLKVYRVGELQDSSSTYGYTLIDSTVTFYPDLTTDESVYIEVTDTSSWSYLSLEVPAPGSFLTFTTKTNITAAGNIYTGNGGSTTDYSCYGLADQYLPTANDGRIYFQYAATDGGDAILAFNSSQTNQRYAASGGSPVNYEVGVWVQSSTGNIYTIDNNVVASAATTASVGEYLSIYVSGSTVKIQRSSDGVSWTDIKTCTYTRSGNLYPNINMNLGTKIYYPKGVNLQ